MKGTKDPLQSDSVPARQSYRHVLSNGYYKHHHNSYIKIVNSNLWPSAFISRMEERICSKCCDMEMCAASQTEGHSSVFV